MVRLNGEHRRSRVRPGELRIATTFRVFFPPNSPRPPPGWGGPLEHSAKQPAKHRTPRSSKLFAGRRISMTRIFHVWNEEKRVAFSRTGRRQFPPDGPIPDFLCWRGKPDAVLGGTTVGQRNTRVAHGIRRARALNRQLTRNCLGTCSRCSCSPRSRFIATRAEGAGIAPLPVCNLCLKRSNEPGQNRRDFRAILPQQLDHAAEHGGDSLRADEHSRPT